MEGIDGWTVATDGTGWIAVGVTQDNGTTVGRIHDLTVPRGRAWAERWCAGRGPQRVEVRLTGGAGPRTPRRGAVAATAGPALTCKTPLGAGLSPV